MPGRSARPIWFQFLASAARWTRRRVFRVVLGGCWGLTGLAALGGAQLRVRSLRGDCVVELPRHGAEALAAVACHGVDIPDEAARERVDNFRWGTGGCVGGLVCSFACSRVGRAGRIGR